MNRRTAVPAKSASPVPPSDSTDAARAASTISARNANVPAVAANVARYLKPKKGLKIAHVGTYPPRKCGIATYMRDVISAVHSDTPTAPPVVVALVAPDEEIVYGWPVQFRIAQDDPADYARVAHELNALNVDLVSIQHEHGIFGGPAGDMLTAFLDALDAPVVTTLHTVLPDPSPEVALSIQNLASRSARIVVLNSKAIPLLAQAYNIPTDNVVVIPHGTPDMDPSRRPKVRAEFGVENQTVLATFGLISPGKGLEHAIAAVAANADAFPNLHYYILGQTHPGIVRHSGETYREGLQAQAESAGVTDRVHFVNEYLSQNALTDWLLAADIYVTPYLNPHQISSGTLAYAVAAGKPVLSTPYLHAQELLESGARGVLTPFNNPGAMGENLGRMLADETGRAAMGRASWAWGRTSVWSNVARRYWEAFTGAVAAGDSADAAPATPSPAERGSIAPSVFTTATRDRPAPRDAAATSR